MNKNRYLFALICACAALCCHCVEQKASNQPLSASALFRLSRANKFASSNNQQQQQASNNNAAKPTLQQQQQQQTGAVSTTTTTTTTTTTSATNLQAATSSTTLKPTSLALTSSSASNRNARASDIFANGDGFNIFVTNTCELESMRVDVRTSRPFFGVIHTKNERQKPACVIEGDGSTDYSLSISHILTPSEPQYCGVVRARRNSPDDKDILSVVIAVRLHKNIELSEDKFFLLNCTNRCRKPDCSSPVKKLAELVNNPEIETEDVSKTTNENECTIYKFPWAVALLWCMAIMLIALMISHCILCSSFRCRWQKSEIEDREESVFEETDYGTSDDDDNDAKNFRHRQQHLKSNGTNNNNSNNKHYQNTHNKRLPNTTTPKTNVKQHPIKIQYDNKDIYKTSSDYRPYNSRDTQVKSSRR